MGRCAEDRRFFLDFANHGQEPFALRRIVPKAIKVLCQPTWTFDGYNFDNVESSRQKLPRQFPWAMKVGIREVQRIARRIAMLAVFQVTVENGRESWLVKKAVRK